MSTTFAIDFIIQEMVQKVLIDRLEAIEKFLETETDQFIVAKLEADRIQCISKLYSNSL